MRILGERSLVSFLKVMVDIAYFGLLALTALVIVIVVVFGIVQPEGLSVSLPARFDIDQTVYDIVAKADPTGQEVTIEDVRGNVAVKGVTAERLVQGLAAAIVLLGLSIVVLRQFRGIFRTLKAGTPFVQANVTRIRILGFALMLGELFRAAMVAWSSHALGRNFASEQIRFRDDFEPSMTIILAGVLLLVLAEIFREAASMKRDLETAREIQFELVPAEEFRQGQVAVRSRMRPANTVGGDYYDVVPLGEGRVAVVQADVAGKGMPAALLMAALQGSLRTLISAGLRGAKLVETLNDYLNDNTPDNRMVTLFYGELDLAGGEMMYVNAGHNRPFLIRRGGALERPGDSATVLGILPGREYTEAQLRLESGDRLLLFTDGVSEAFDPKDAEYGDERVAGYLNRHTGADAENLVAGLIGDVLAFCKPARPTDDITLTLISRD